MTANDINKETIPVLKTSILKRVFDVSLALMGLILSSPIWLVVSLIIYAEDRGPVFFRQERCGKDGKPFNTIKFRTMKVNPEKKNVVIDIDNDPRISRSGRLLRASALDELPGLLNIIRGDMSFVGPRALPYKVEGNEKELYVNISQIPGYAIRSRVQPGLTGLAQIYLPKDSSNKDKFEYDALYVSKRSFRLDLKLVFLSFWITFTGKWEHRGKKI